MDEDVVGEERQGGRQRAVGRSHHGNDTRKARDPRLRRAGRHQDPDAAHGPEAEIRLERASDAPRGWIPHLEVLAAETRSVCDFIMKDLPRPVDTETEVCFSYAPNTDTRIFNASLLAAEVLASVGQRTGENELIELADRATRYVVNKQQPDGSWSYGTDPKQSWIDSFHTAYILFSLKRIIAISTRKNEFQPALDRGYQYWKNNFFLADGWPKYYDHDLYPADAHAAASAIVTFLECRELDNDALRLAQNVATWAIQNLRDSRGFFYYQRRRFYTVRKPYMRWTQAWMLYALSRLLEELNGQVNKR